MTKKNLGFGLLAWALVGPIAGGFSPVARAAEETPKLDNAASGAPQVEAPENEPLPGQLSSKFRIDDRNPEESVPTAALRDKNPLEYGYFIQDLLEHAESARKRQDYKAVILYYRAVAKAVPESAKGWSKLCEAYEVVNDRDRAIRACRYALDRPSVELGDYIRYVHLILGKDGALTADDRKALDGVLEHLDKQPPSELAASHLRCEVGVKAKDVALMQRCTTALAKLAPNDPKTIVFQWSLAVQKGERTEARQLLEKAKKAGIVLANLERMEKVTNGYGRVWPRLLAAVVVCALAALAVWVYMRRRGRRIA